MPRASRSASIRRRRCRASRRLCAPTAASAASSAACACSSSTGGASAAYSASTACAGPSGSARGTAASRSSPNDTLAAKQWYLQHDRAFDFWPEAPLLPPVKVGVVDSGIDLTHPDLATHVLLARSFVGGTVADVDGHGTFIAGEIAASDEQRRGNRRHRLSCAAPRREGRPQRRVDLPRGRGQGDSLGGRQRRARDQPQPGRPARPGEPFPRHVLAARGGGGAVRRREGRARRRGRRQRRRTDARLAVAVRELPGGAAARRRRQLDPAATTRSPPSRTATRSSTTSPRRA